MSNRVLPSRAFLIEQSVLNALDLERREYLAENLTVRQYARQRFGNVPRDRWAGVYGFAMMVRTCFRTLVAQYEA